MGEKEASYNNEVFLIIRRIFAKVSNNIIFVLIKKIMVLR